MTEAVVSEGERAAAFDEFFQAHYERLLRVLFLAGGDRHEAEDLVQEAFVKVYERWDRVRGLDDPVGYLYRVALNARRSRMRRLRIAATKALQLGSEPAVDQHDATEDRLTVRRALSGLPDSQREALVLVEWVGMTDAEAGQALGVTPGAVRTRLHRARSALRDVLRGEHDE